MKTYRLADTMTRDECDHFGVPTWTNPRVSISVSVRAILTGEKRAPKAGEWFLSGALPVAYRAVNGMYTEYHILKLVKVRRTRPLIEVVLQRGIGQ